jgi:transcription antitermination factor NusG
MSCGSRPGSRWFCAWTHPGGEFRAELHLAEQAFIVCLPLHLDNRFVREVGHPHIGPMFPSYLFVNLNLARDQWRLIYRTRGIAGMIGATTDRPTALRIGLVEELIARMSPRRIVDDPASLKAPRKLWRDFGGLSGKARGDLLLQQLGQDVAAAA